MRQQDKRRVYLPILDLSTKTFALESHGYLKPEKTISESLDDYGVRNSRRPVHLLHAHWCKFSTNHSCSCNLFNLSPPKQIRVRIECTKTHIKPILEFAAKAQENGGSMITNDILDCIEAQTKIEARGRAFAMVFPCLETEWNHGLGTKALVRLRTAVNSKEASDLQEGREEAEDTQIMAERRKAPSDELLSSFGGEKSRASPEVVMWEEPNDEGKRMFKWAYKNKINFETLSFKNVNSH